MAREASLRREKSPVPYGSFYIFPQGFPGHSVKVTGYLEIGIEIGVARRFDQSVRLIPYETRSLP